MVGAAWLFLVPIWITVWFERHPLLGLAQGLMIMAFLWRHGRAELRGETRDNPTRNTRDARRIP